jgi:PAS domain S-box-containing protein
MIGCAARSLDGSTVLVRATRQQQDLHRDANEIAPGAGWQRPAEEDIVAGRDGVTAKERWRRSGTLAMGYGRPSSIEPTSPGHGAPESPPRLAASRTSAIHASDARSPVGPLLAGRPAWLRYATALLMVCAMAALRLAAVPLMGVQAPLLPFSFVVLAVACVAGLGPALATTALAVVITTLQFANLDDPTEAAAWTGHATLFLSLGVLVSVLVHRLQQAYRTQQLTLAAATAGEERLRVITDAMPAVIAYVDADCRYRFTNGMYQEWFGLSPDQLLGRHLRDVLGQAAYDVVKPYVSRALAGEAVDFEMEVPYLTGGTRWISAHYVPDLDSGGAVRGYFALVEDVSDRKHKEALLVEADRRKDEFLSMLAHELRNPLAPIRTAGRLLIDERTDLDTMRRLGAMVQRQVANLSRIVDDLLDVARIRTGKIELRKEIVVLDDVLDRAVETLQGVLDERRQTVAVTRSPAALCVLGDPVRLEQAIVNLLVNASKFSPQLARIEVSVGADDDTAVVRVRDPGIGIDGQLLPRVFDLFVQAQQSLDRGNGGLGIGLTLVRWIVEGHGGTVEARSEGPGKGSEFLVRLPRVPDVSSIGSLPAAVRGRISA